MDYIKNMIYSYLYDTNKEEENFKKPSAYKNINTSTSIKTKSLNKNNE